MPVPDKFKTYQYKNSPNYSQRPDGIRFCEHVDGTVLLPPSNETHVGSEGTLADLIGAAVGAAFSVEVLQWSVTGNTGTVVLSSAPVSPNKVLFFMESGVVYRGTLQVSISGNTCTIDASAYGVTDNQPVLILVL